MSPGGAAPERVFPRRSDASLWREVEGSAVLFHEESGRAFALNETATRIWAACDGTRSLAEMSGLLDKEAAAQAGRIVADLAAAGFIELLPRPKNGARRAKRAAGEGSSGQETAGTALPFSTLYSQSAPALRASREAPHAEEIVFTLCDCATGIGLVRNAQCALLLIPQQSMSGI